MPTTFEQMRAYFEQGDWHLTDPGDGKSLHVQFTGRNGTFRCTALADDANATIVFRSHAPDAVPQERHEQMVRFVTLANFGRLCGSLDYDIDAGAVSCRTFLRHKGLPLTPVMMENLVRPNVHNLDRYVPGIQRVFRGLNADMAVRMAENAY